MGERPTKFGRRYPWAEWFGRGEFTLHQKSDYNGRTDSMAQCIRNAASARGLKCSITIHDDGKGLTARVGRKATRRKGVRK